MTKVYYKATRPDGWDFYTGKTINYADKLGERVTVPSKAHAEGYACCTPDVLHASVEPAETLIGGAWPCRLFEVSGRPVASEGHKRGFRSFVVVREVEAWRALGPMGREVAALIQAAGKITNTQAAELAARDAARDAVRYAARDAVRYAARYAARYAVRYAARYAARDAVRYAARDAVRDAARYAARYAAWDAAEGLLVRDLIGTGRFAQADYDELTRAWRTVVGPIHPDDQALRGE